MAQTTNKRRTESIRKRSDNSDNRASAPWPDLPNDLLISILMKLSFIDYFAFCGVCKLWMNAAKAHKKIFMKCQQPLAVVKSTHAKRACLLYDIFGGRKYKAMLPDLIRRSFVGLSCGYLIMLDDDFRFCLVNLFTRHELQFPVIPWYVEKFCYKNQLRPILFYSTKLSDYLMVFVDRTRNSILIAQSRGAKWFAIQNLNNSDSIVDVTIFKGKIYFLTNAARFGELKMRPSPILQLLRTNIFSIPNVLLFPSLQLVTSRNCIFMVSHPHPRLNLDYKDIIIFKLDNTKMDWMKINDLGQKALFLSDMKCSAIVDPTKWGGLSNCVYVCEWMINKVSVYPLDGVGKRLEDIPVVQEGSDTLVPYFWYIPRKGEKMNESDEEFDL